MKDPDLAYARRGAEFTFNSNKFVKDIIAAKKAGKFLFPSFDHAKKDPEEGKIKFDSLLHKIVIIEGLYVNLNKSPWN